MLRGEGSNWQNLVTKEARCVQPDGAGVTSSRRNSRWRRALAFGQRAAEAGEGWRGGLARSTVFGKDRGRE